MLQSREGCKDQKWAATRLDLEKMVEEGYALDGLSQTHFVCENHIAVLIPGDNQPVHTLQLVISQKFVVPEDWRRRLGVLRNCLFSRENVIEIQLVSQVRQCMGIEFFGRIIFVFDQGFMSLILVDHMNSRFLVQSPIEISEFKYLWVFVADRTLKFPC